ncbi:MAG: methionyl-tRNA formyltransferase [Bacteroidetes bacterium]|nr:methionyl-tRNA formyltransferase [Bacteroidota bacterium]MBS1684831.1 methionyl-tRNA formyltransferase [Bacteroidota bacterium]
MSRPLKVVFLGTPEFAVAMLDILHHSQHEVAAVITAPDKPAGRGMNLSESEVKKYAVAHGLRILQPEKLKNEHFIKELREIQADIFVVVAFRMLPEVVWNMPPLGTINLHASLLPQYRGAAPINWAIINGEKETGVTTFRLRHEIDTGMIIYQDKVQIRDDETVGELYHELMDIGKHTLLRTIDAIADGDYPQIPQDHIIDIKHAPKINKETGSIDWNKDAVSIYNLIRGLSPYPAAWTSLYSKTIKIYKASKHEMAHSMPIGVPDTDGKTFLRYYCTDGYLDILDLQLEGKKRMGIGEFLRGHGSSIVSA